MYDDYLYRNGTVGLHNCSIKVIAKRVAYPVALNYANHCEIDVYGEHMHRCVYLCGDYNTESPFRPKPPRRRLRFILLCATISACG